MSVLCRNVITIPMFYVNAKPHIGHLYSALLGDVIARWHRLGSCSDWTLVVGTDEHGLKVKRRAAKDSMTTSTFCDKMSACFEAMFNKASIEYTYMVRTTSPEHKRTVSNIWETLRGQGLIVPGSFEGWYSEADETFYGDDDVSKCNTGDVVSKITGSRCEMVKETNYMFKLDEFKDKIIDWINRDRPITESHIAQNVLEQLRLSPGSVSVSRPTARCDWGIPVPHDSNQVIYVWFDALCSYLTATCNSSNLLWSSSQSPGCQIIGKDILRFHTVMWPAMLLALGLPLPRRIICHGHWLSQGRKMSKSLGNTVDVDQILDMFSSDGLRYAMLTHSSLMEANDTNFDIKELKFLVNSEFADNIGNLLRRSVSRSINPSGAYPLSPTSKLLPNYWVMEVIDHYNHHRYSKALSCISQRVRSANLDFYHAKPWLSKSSTGGDQINAEITWTTYEVLRRAAILLQPITPVLSTRILKTLGVRKRTISASLEGNSENATVDSDCGVLFPKVS